MVRSGNIIIARTNQSCRIIIEISFNAADLDLCMYRKILSCLDCLVTYF